MTVTKVTSKKKKLFLEKMKSSLCNVTASCEAVNIARKTFYEWMKKDEKFRQAVDDLQERDIDFVESQLYKQIKDGDTTATIFYLKTKGRKRGYSEKLEIDGSLNVSQHLSPEECKERLKQLEGEY